MAKRHQRRQVRLFTIRSRQRHTSQDNQRVTRRHSNLKLSVNMRVRRLNFTLLILMQRNNLHGSPTLLRVSQASRHRPLRHVRRQRQTRRQVIRRKRCLAMQGRRISIILPNRLLHGNLITRRTLTTLLNRRLTRITNRVIGTILRRVSRRHSIIMNTRGTNVTLFARVSSQGTTLNFKHSATLFISPHGRDIRFNLITSQRRRATPRGKDVSDTFRHHGRRGVLFRISAQFTQVLRRNRRMLLLLNKRILIFVRFNLSPSVGQVLIRVTNFTLLRRQYKVSQRNRGQIYKRSTTMVHTTTTKGGRRKHHHGTNRLRESWRVLRVLRVWGRSSWKAGLWGVNGPRTISNGWVHVQHRGVPRTPQATHFPKVGYCFYVR